jgi:predicted Zn-dependent protease with MMP-like domain
MTISVPSRPRLSDEQALAEKVKKLVYYEIGHYFGLSEDDLSYTSVK